MKGFNLKLEYGKILFRFQIDFYQISSGNQIFNLLPDFGANKMQLNSKIGGDWGAEEKFDMQIKKAEIFNIGIYFETDRYYVTIFPLNKLCIFLGFLFLFFPVTGVNWWKRDL